MKSPMITNAYFVEEKEKEKYSDLQVLCSAAGWYIGTIHTDNELGVKEPGSRDTEYFKSRLEADVHLDLLEMGESDLILRMIP